MSQEIIINTLDDIQAGLQQVLESKEEVFTLTVNPELRFTIVMKGRSWDGLVDIRVAKFVTELQHAFDRVRKELGVVDEGRPLVKVRIKDGSTEIETKVFDIIAETLRGMTNQQQFIILLSFMGVALAGWTLRQVLHHLRERGAARLAHASTQQNADLARELNQTVQFAIEKIDGEKPLRSLVNSMREEDQVILPDNAVLTKREARARFPRKHRVSPIDVVLDDNYRVDHMMLGQPVQLTLSKGDIDFKAAFSHGLKAEDTTALLAEVKQALEQQKPMRVALQIDGRVNDQSVMHAVIIGIGRPPREGAHDVMDLLG